MTDEDFKPTTEEKLPPKRKRSPKTPTQQSFDILRDRIKALSAGMTALERDNETLLTANRMLAADKTEAGHQDTLNKARIRKLEGDIASLEDEVRQNETGKATLRRINGNFGGDISAVLKAYDGVIAESATLRKDHNEKADLLLKIHAMIYDFLDKHGIKHVKADNLADVVKAALLHIGNKMMSNEVELKECAVMAEGAMSACGIEHIRGMNLGQGIRATVAEIRDKCVFLIRENTAAKNKIGELNSRIEGYERAIPKKEELEAYLKKCTLIPGPFITTKMALDMLSSTLAPMVARDSNRDEVRLKLQKDLDDSRKLLTGYGDGITSIWKLIKCEVASSPVAWENHDNNVDDVLANIKRLGQCSRDLESEQRTSNKVLADIDTATLEIASSIGMASAAWLMPDIVQRIDSNLKSIKTNALKDHSNARDLRNELTRHRDEINKAVYKHNQCSHTLEEMVAQIEHQREKAMPGVVHEILQETWALLKQARVGYRYEGTTDDAAFIRKSLKDVGSKIHGQHVWFDEAWVLVAGEDEPGGMGLLMKRIEELKQRPGFLLEYDGYHARIRDLIGEESSQVISSPVDLNAALKQTFNNLKKYIEVLRQNAGLNTLQDLSNKARQLVRDFDLHAGLDGPVILTNSKVIECALGAAKNKMTADDQFILDLHTITETKGRSRQAMFETVHSLVQLEKSGTKKGEINKKLLYFIDQMCERLQLKHVPVDFTTPSTAHTAVELLLSTHELNVNNRKLTMDHLDDEAKELLEASKKISEASKALASHVNMANATTPFAVNYKKR